MGAPGRGLQGWTEASADGGASAGWRGRHHSPETSDVLLTSLVPLKSWGGGRQCQLTILC